MYAHAEITQYAVRGFLEASKSFDIYTIKSLVEKMLEDEGGYYDPVVEKDLKAYLVALFEAGSIPGYCVTVRPAVDEEGPKMVLEFAPENPYSTLDLILKPDKGQLIRCKLHTQYKDLLKFICAKSGCTQEMMVRSILVKALDLINDQLK